MRKNIYILVLSASFIISPNLFGQTSEMVSGAKPDAIKLDAFGRVPNGDMRGRLDVFLAEIYNRGKQTKGVVVNYGTVREMDARKRIIANHIYFRQFDSTLISFIRGGNASEMRTDLFIVPSGARQPVVEPEAFIVSEFGKVTKTAVLSKMQTFFREFANWPDHQGFIINYGTNREIAKREKWITDAIVFRSFDRARITLVRGGPKSGPRTVMWLVPPGANNPPV